MSAIPSSSLASNASSSNAASSNAASSDLRPATALYLYCVASAADPVPALLAPALDGGRVRAVRHLELAAFAHRCPPEPYQTTDKTEVQGWIAAHNAVVEEAWAQVGAVLPMGFDVIVRPGGGRSAEANLVGWLAAHYQALRQRLAAVEGRAELGVQILWSADRPLSSMGVDASAADAPARGRAFFARQQLRQQLKEQLEADVETESRRYFAQLAALADEVAVNEARPVKDRQMVLNLSLLVARTEVSRMGEYLEGVSREPGVEVRFTGPWPPYSFAGTFDTIGDGEPSRAAAGNTSTRGDAL